MANRTETNINLKLNRVPDETVLEDMVANHQILPNQFYMLPSVRGDGLVALQIKKLWENPSPNSSFAAQTITTLDMSSYSYLLIDFKAGTSNDVLFTQLTKKGIDGRLVYGNSSGDHPEVRNFTFPSNTTIAFQNAYFNGNIANSNVIPVTIIGIKVVESHAQLNNKYSTEETVVGEWIDGKKIYRKVWYYDTAFNISYNDWTNLGFESATYNMDKFISGKAINDGNTFYWISVAKNVDNIHVHAQATRTSTIGSIKYIILEYTKTTD